MIRTSLVTLLITLLIASPARAQAPAQVSRLSATSTALLVETRAIDTQTASTRRDSRWNGFLIGALVGAIPGVIAGVGFKTYCANEARDCGAAVPALGVFGGLVGGLVGAAVDDAIGNSITPARRPLEPAVRWSVRF